MRTIAIVLSIAVFAAAQERYAHVIIRKNDQSGMILGVLHLNQPPQGGLVKMIGKIEGLEEGRYYVFLHLKGDLTEQCNSTGNAYLAWDPIYGDEFHPDIAIGHIGNVEFSSEKKAFVNLTSDWMTIAPPDVVNSIIDRSIVFHGPNIGNATELLDTGDHASSYACGVVISGEDAATRELPTTLTDGPIMRINIIPKGTFVCCNNGGGKNLTINIRLGRP